MNTPKLQQTLAISIKPQINPTNIQLSTTINGEKLIEKSGKLIYIDQLLAII